MDWSWLQNLLSMDWIKLLGTFTAAVASLIAFFLLVPGEEPEKTLQKILDFLKKFSLK